MAVRRFLVAFGKRLALPYGIEAVRGFVLRRIKDVTPDDLYKAIKEGIDDIWGISEDRDRRVGRRFAGKFKEYQDELTPKLVFKWLAHDRPDLASVIANMPEGRGYTWLKSAVEKLKEKLFS